VRASDRGRADYLRRYHGVDWLDPTLYHLVINTGWVSVATAVDLIVAAQQALAQVPAAQGSPSSSPAPQDRPSMPTGQAYVEDE
jgi:hypothetical protein